MSAKVISKGGTSKTTCSVNIVDNLIMRGYKTLLIDLDSSRNCTMTIAPQSLDSEHNIGTVLDKQDKIQDAIQTVNGIDIVPATNILLNNLNMTLPQEDPGNYEHRLKEALIEIKDLYDFIIIDNPPVLQALSYNSLIASDYIIIPCQADDYSLYCIKDLINFIDDIRQSNEYLKILGIFFSRYRNRAQIQQSTKNNFINLASSVGTTLFNTTIPESSDLIEAQTRHQSIFKSNKHSVAAKAYSDLTAEILQTLDMEVRCNVG